jgi:hypothetical protein
MIEICDLAPYGGFMRILKEKWIKDMKKSLSLMGTPKDNLDSTLEKLFKERFKDTDVHIYNSYEEEVYPMTLSGVIDWIDKRNPNICESGIFFKRAEEEQSINALLSKEDMDDRGKLKKLRFIAMDAGDAVLEKYYNMGQLDCKLLSNAGYGVTANPYSFSHSFAVAASITSCGRGETSMAAQSFENFLGDTVRFNNLDECLVYVSNCLKDFKIAKFFTDEIIDIIPSRDDLIDKLYNKFRHKDEDVLSNVSRIVSNLSKEEVTRIYYKTNFKAFIYNKAIRKLFRFIMENDEAKMIDPYEVEECVKAELYLLGDLMNEFVGYRYQPYQYEYRTRFDKRSNIPVIDTDSNIIYVNNLIELLIDDILKVRLFKTKKAYDEYNTKLVNIFSHLLSENFKMSVKHYLKNVRVDDPLSKILMKNEYHFGLLFVTTSKKSYIASKKRQEGVVFDKPKLEIKGVTFFKSTSTQKVTNFIYDEILFKRILEPKGGKINTIELMEKIAQFKADMVKDIRSGNMEYYKKAKVRSENGYKDAMSFGPFKASFIWNEITDGVKNEYPCTSIIVPVVLKRRKDFAALENYPEVYQRLVNLVDNNPYFNKNKAEKKEGKEPKPNEPNINFIGIPDSLDDLPDWLLEIIDINKIIELNMSLFNQLYKPLGCGPVATNSNNYTNIIRI